MFYKILNLSVSLTFDLCVRGFLLDPRKQIGRIKVSHIRVLENLTLDSWYLSHQNYHYILSNPVPFNQGVKNELATVNKSFNRHICHHIWWNKHDSTHVVKGDRRFLKGSYMGSCLSKSVKVDTIAFQYKEKKPEIANRIKMEEAEENIDNSPDIFGKSTKDKDTFDNKSVDDEAENEQTKDLENGGVALEEKTKEQNKKLTPSEIEDKAESIIAGLKAKVGKACGIENYDQPDDEGHFPVTTRNLAVVSQKSYFDLKGVPLERLSSFRKAVASVLIEIKVVDIMIEIHRYYAKHGWRHEVEGVLKSDKLKWSPLLNATLVLLNFSDASDQFAVYIGSKEEFLDSIRSVMLGSEEAHLRGDQEDQARKFTEYAVSLSHNISMRDATIQQLRNFDFTTAIKPYLQSPAEMVKLNALATLASIVDERESEIINTNQGTVKLLLTCLQKGIDNPLRRHNRWSCKESAFAVRMLARNDSNKKMLSELGAVEILVKVGQTGNEEEKYECVHALWTLAFDPDIRQEMVEKEDIGLIDLLTDIKNTCQSPAIKKACNGALWTMREELKASKNEKFKQLGLHQEGGISETVQRPTKKKKKMAGKVKEELGHIMISYQWGDQNTLMLIRDRLKEHGLKVWMDIDQMAGSTLQAMADAVENASIILMAMSHKYKDSPNCRAEAEYAFQKRKKIIPLLMEGGYAADGWLGFILGAKLFYNFSGKYPFENKMEELLWEITTVQQKMEGKEVDESVPQSSTSAYSSQHHQTASVPQKVSQSRPNIVSMTTVSKVRNWKPADVQNWINKNDLNGCGVSHLTGGEVALLMTMKHEAPEYFYKCLETMLRVNDLLTMSKIVWALSDLSGEVQIC